MLLVAGLPFAALLGNVVYILSNPMFTPTTRLQPVADVLAIAAALAFAAVASREEIASLRRHLAQRLVKPVLRGLLHLLVAPLFIWAVVQVFFAGPLSYLLHRHAGAEHETRVIMVLRADDFGGRGCRNRAILPGGGRLAWQPVLCNIPDSAVRQLRRGGQVKVQGTFSAYGSQVRYYAAVAPDG